MLLELKDSQYIDGIPKEDWRKTSLYCQAVDKLSKEIKEKKVEFFSLGGKKQELEDVLIWYTIESTQKKSKTSIIIIDKAQFYTSHYIGFYATKIDDEEINIVVKPRFGDKIFNYLVSYAYGIYLPKGFSSSSDSKADSLWLIALMWKATLQKAMTKSQIPKEYQKFQKNLSTYRGQLNISQHIKHNLFDKSKFYCNYRKLTMDTTINQTIRQTYKILKKRGYGNLLNDIVEYDTMLQSFGVQAKEVNLKSIANIRYSKLNIYYKKVMELSSLILKSESKSSDKTSTNSDSFSYFFDIAELWENYLLKVLQKHLPNFNIYSPNERGGISLFDDGCREIRPDIIIEKNGKVIAILDAKYKWYSKIGKYANEANAVSRDDLYQMSTYLYHYGKDSEKIIGLFISPIEQKGIDLKILKNNENHKIGVLNLDIIQFDKDEDDNFSLESINQEEKNFINKIKKELQYDPI